MIHLCSLLPHQKLFHKELMRPLPYMATFQSRFYAAPVVQPTARGSALLHYGTTPVCSAAKLAILGHTVRFHLTLIHSTSRSRLRLALGA